MAWDDNKNTAANPNDPDPDEILSADEWNTHTTDQLSRLEYGELSNRPKAEERSDGTLWMDEHGRISRVDSDSWVVMSFGDSANKIPGTSQFDTVAVDGIDGGVASEAITDLEGDNLSVDAGSLTAAGGGLTTTTIDDTNSPYTTQDEDVICCDTSSGQITVDLASADVTLGNEIRVVNIDGTNPVTVTTEGSETIDPNATAAKEIAEAGWAVSFVSGGTNWDSSLVGEFNSVITEQTNFLESGTQPSSPGEFRRDGDDVKVYSGGGVKNLSNVGSGGGGGSGASKTTARRYGLLGGN